MKEINRVMLAENKTEQITIFDSEMTRYFEERGIGVETSILKICTLVPSVRFELEADHAYMQALHYACKGYKLNDIDYVPLVVAASDSRKATAAWFAKEVAGEYWRWAMCGLTLPQISGKIAINKYMAYLGLLSSASKRFSEVFGKEINVNRIAVIDDGYVKVTGVVDVVENGVVEKNVEREIEINAFDGMGLIRSELTEGESVTIRGPWIKAFVQATNWSELASFGFKNTGDTKFKTLYGERCLKDVDIILTRSCFKASKLYESWEQYANAFVAYGHHISVCVREHAPKLKGMPYQQGQTLQGTDADVEHFAQHGWSTMKKYQNKKEAVDLLSGWHKAAAKVYPALLKEKHTVRTMQEKWSSKKLDMLGGRIPELGYNAFIAADMKAFAEHLFGLPVVGSLKTGECACMADVLKEGMTDITRSPHLDNAHVLLMNVKKMPFVPKNTPTMFINIWDLTTIKLRCDYDGDHVWYSQDEHLLDLVIRTYDRLGNLPVDWAAPESKKGVVNKNAVAEFVANLLKGSEIGLYADALTKMWANGYDREVCDWLTYAGNVLIDAAKHGNIRIVKPDAVKEVDTLSLPEFCRYAKADKEHPADSKYWTEERITKNGDVIPPRTRYTGCFLDRFNHRVKELIPDTLEVNGLEDEIFDSYILLIKPDRKYGKLTGLSRKSRVFNPETGKYEDGGLFQKIAFRHADEWNAIVKADKHKLDYKAWEEEKAKEARQEMLDWARAQYGNSPEIQAVSDDRLLEAIYDIVTRNVYNTFDVSDGYDTVIKNMYWKVFGKMAYNTICYNLGIEALEFVPEIDDDEEDEDD